MVNLFQGKTKNQLDNHFQDITKLNINQYGT